MKVELNLEQGYCKVTKENGDPRFKRGGWSDAESTFLYRVLQELKKQGYDVIKKRAWKDGNLVDDNLQYIRSRKTEPHGFYIWNHLNAVYDAGEEFNKDGHFDLSVEIW